MALSRLLLISLLAITCCSEHRGSTYETESKTDDARISLPDKCREFEREYHEDEWDEETESYPANYEWERCMLVR
jgi:hypothetical protein